MNKAKYKQDIFKKSGKVFGWLHPDEKEELFRLANKGPAKGAIVEIGSYVGKSTICLAGGTKIVQREKVHAIDPHYGSEEHQPGNTAFFKQYYDSKTKSLNTYPAFLDNIKKADIDDYVIPFKSTSEQAASTWNLPIRLLFIDGAHDYDSVKKDISMWNKHMVKGGIIAFHDYGKFSGVTNAVSQYIEDHKDIISNTRQVVSLFLVYLNK